jgi:Protein of unknown function (DUF4199)
MKQTVFRYGIYAAMLIVVLMAFNLFFLPKVAGYAVQEVAGYLAILLSMIFVFLGVSHFRDHVNDGALSFMEGLKVGLLIALIPSVFFGLFDLLYTQVINPGWHEDYYNHHVQELKASIPADKITTELEKLESQRKLFSKPYMEFLLMFLTVFVIGAIVTIISALTLRRSKPAIT